MKAWVRRVSLLAASVLWSAASVPRSGSIHWGEIEQRMGSITLDGTLRWSAVILERREPGVLGLRHVLEHRMEIDGLGRARTAWHVTGLVTWIAPEGQNQLRWQPLHGAAVRFDRRQIGRAFGTAGDPRLLIRESAPGDWEIRSRDGRFWRYRRGTLNAFEQPGVGSFEVATQGGLVGEIFDVATPEAPPKLRARYDAAGHLLELSDGEKTHRFSWSADGLLREWRKPDDTAVRFTYRDGLVSGIAEPGREPRRFSWVENPGWQRGDSKWPTAARLAADEASDYFCALTSAGLQIAVHNRATGDKVVNTFNPLRRRLEQRWKGETLLVTFRRGAAAGGAVERIETAEGTVLERYRYDERGLLVAIERKGEPARTLRYDESFRLMALEEHPLR